MSCTCLFGKGTLTCHCAACHVTFTGAESFDRHQTIENGKVVCRDPATWMKDDGDPLFMAYRETPDGKPVWGRYRPDLPQRTFPVPA